MKQLTTVSIVLTIFLSFSALCSAGQSGAVESTGVPVYKTIAAGESFDISRYAGKRVVLFIYSIDDQRAVDAVLAMNGLHSIRREYNFEVVGLALDFKRLPDVERFNLKTGVPFRVYSDSGNVLAKQLKMRGRLGFYIYNKAGKVVSRKWAMYTPAQVSLQNAWQGYASRYLGFEHIPSDQPVLGALPPVPRFSAKTIDKQDLRIDEVCKSRPVVLVIFSTNCGNCKKELAFLNSLYTTGDLQGKFEIVAVSLRRAQETIDFAEKHKYTFPIIVDRGRRISSLFPSFLGPVPVSFVIDTQARIAAVHTGFSSYLKDVYTMELKKLIGMENPPLLVSEGYSGAARCLVCHENEHSQWRLTGHSSAFGSLVRKGKESDENCIACHVTGFAKPGGYQLKHKKKARHLKNVQCEACHGPGFESCRAFAGDKTKKKKTADWKKTCLVCHTDKESLNFVFKRRFPKVRHTNMPEREGMSRDARLQLLQAAGNDATVFDNPAAYVGAGACKKCHRDEYNHWQKTAHAAAHKSDRGKAALPDKLFRFNTGVGEAGGYPGPGRDGVQCESCHGPGEKHIAKPEAKGQDYIVGLGTECPSCVVEQICRRCHSPEDDPEFVFDSSIEKVRHNKKQP
ncbi:MAG: redoxin domain-containing protein [Deltaproteobacteria bacterium]|nr:redoxin domain-containing protein [Deltaproteobacteria bacterium]